MTPISPSKAFTANTVLAATVTGLNPSHALRQNEYMEMDLNDYIASIENTVNEMSISLSAMYVAIDATMPEDNEQLLSVQLTVDDLLQQHQDLVKQVSSLQLHMERLMVHQNTVAVPVTNSAQYTTEIPPMMDLTAHTSSVCDVLFTIPQPVSQPVTDYLTGLPQSLGRASPIQSVDQDVTLSSAVAENSSLNEKSESLSYYEIDRRNVEIGQFIGAGRYTAVYDGTLNISKQWPSKSIITRLLKGCFCAQKILPVAITTVAETTLQEDIEEVKKVMQDKLKLMCSLGSHPNIETLIAGVTVCDNFNRTLIITDNRVLGNLISFLRAHRFKFVPLEITGTIGNRPSGNAYSHTFASIEHMLVNYMNRENNENFETDLSRMITTAHLLSFAMQIAEGMEYLAAKKVVHGDLSAKNIILTTDGLCKISGFGSAVKLGNRNHIRIEDDLPIRWLAVECLTDRKFSTQSDIWSYGILLYEIFTLGELPYPNKHIPSSLSYCIIKGLRNDQPRHCPDEIYHLMTLCWNSEAAKRPAFCEPANLIRKHLSIQVQEKVRIATLKETKRQRRLELRRSQTSKNL